MFRQAKATVLGQTPRAKAAASAVVGSPVPLGALRLPGGWLRPWLRRGPTLVLPPKPLWFEKGWRQGADPSQYTGVYTAAGSTWRGLIQQPYPQHYDAYIWHPPLTEIRRNTTHGPCFMGNGETGRYRVHFHTVPTSLEHAITSIETVLAQACTDRK